jgi:hypothetical protein
MYKEYPPIITQVPMKMLVPMPMTINIHTYTEDHSCKSHPRAFSPMHLDFPRPIGNTCLASSLM